MEIMIKTITLTTLMYVIVGCSSAPTQIKYFELNGEAVAIPNVLSKPEKQVHLMPLQVPDYMQQSKLVMRTAPFEMHFSANNLWAQIPEKDFYTALITDLNAKSSEIAFLSNRGLLKYQEGDTSLFVEITHFYPTEDSDVILNGYWTLNSADTINNATPLKSSAFTITLPLTLDGYGHAVAQQRHLISQLAVQILGQINSD